MSSQLVPVTSPNKILLVDRCHELYHRTLEDYGNLFPMVETNKDWPKYNRLSELGDSRRYGDSILELININKSKDLLPPKIRAHRGFDGPYILFSIDKIDESLSKEQIRESNLKIKIAYLDLIRVYWEGYLAFISELGGADNGFQKFLDNYLVLKFSIFDDNNIIPTEYGYHLNGESIKEFIRSFLVYYALETCFSNEDLDTKIRIKALRIWQKYDPGYQLFFSEMCGYKGFIGDTIDNIIPESFLPNHDPDQQSESEVLITNDKFYGMFGNTYNDRTISKYNLYFLLIECRAEAIQICRSSLNLYGSPAYHESILKFLLKIISYDDEFLELYFGPYTSYRNKGKVLKGYRNLEKKSLDKIAEQKKEEEWTFLQFRTKLRKKNVEISRIKGELCNLKFKSECQITFLETQLREKDRKCQDLKKKCKTLEKKRENLSSNNDELANTVEDLNSQLANQKDENRDLQIKINDQSKSLIEKDSEILKYKSTLNYKKQLIVDLYTDKILSILSEQVDTLGYFSTFNLNPLLTFKANEDNIKQMYRKYSRDYHPDKNNSKMEEMKKLNTAYEILKNKNSYETYLKECRDRARELALKFVD